MSEQERNHRPIARFIPYILVAVNFLGWEVIKRTPVFVSPTISQQALRIHGVIAGSMLLIFACVLFARFCLAGRRISRLYRFEKYLLILLAVDLMALLIGLIRRNALVFLIGDAYKFSVIPLAYFCTVQTLEARDARKLFLFIVILETAVTLESFGVYMVRLAAGIYERAPEHGISLLAFIFFMTSLASGKKLSRRRRNAYSVLLVIIGISWLKISDENGNRRLDDPDDFVRIEIESGLERNIPVIPILVGGAEVPRAQDLPISLQSLVFRNAISVRHDPDFHSDMKRLSDAIDESISSKGSKVKKLGLLAKNKAMVIVSIEGISVFR